MKKIALLVLSILVLAACNDKKNESSVKSENENTTEQALDQEGLADEIEEVRDENGCLKSAGETWSQLQEACVQFFNVGKRLNPVEVKEGEVVLSAFVLLLNDDGSQAELFISDSESTLLLDKVEDHVFQNDPYLYNAEEAILYIDGAEAYKAA